MSLALLLALLWLVGRTSKFGRWRVDRRRGWFRRFRRPLALLWLLTLILSAIAGLASEPNNYDFLTYRLSRILHWWSAGQWHWIQSENERMNISGVGFEWLLTPFLILTRSSRAAVVINLAAFALMPGLVFVTLRRFSVRASVAYQWMWLFPCAYCYTAQAGSAGNDSFAAFYFLAALGFAFQAERTGEFSWLAASMLAAALLTGAKASNLALALPVVLAWWPSRHLLLRHWGLAFLVSMVAVMTSFLPVAIANQHYVGQWAGDPGGTSGLQIFNPVAGIIGNMAQLIVSTFLPPIWPLASQWNTIVVPRLLHTSLGEWLLHNFPRLDLTKREIVGEEDAGIGTGIALLWLVLLVRAVLGPFSARLRDARAVVSAPSRRFSYLLLAAGCISLLVFMAKMGSEADPRILAPYYPVLLMVVLVLTNRSHPRLRGAWLVACLIVQLTPLLLLLIQPERPIVPVDQIARAVLRSPGQNGLLNRIETVYATYRTRADALAPVRELLPPDVHAIGFVANGNQPEVSFWEPFGQRTVIDVVDLNRSAELPAYSVVLASWIEETTHAPVNEWAQRMALQEVGRKVLTLRAHAGPETWILYRKTNSIPGREPNPPGVGKSGSSS